MTDRDAFRAAWPAIQAELPSHQRNGYAAGDVEVAEENAAWEAWQAAIKHERETVAQGVKYSPHRVEASGYQVSASAPLLKCGGEQTGPVAARFLDGDAHC